MTTTGWGPTSSNMSITSPTLQNVNMTSISNKECLIDGAVAHDSVMCTEPSGNQGICRVNLIHIDTFKFVMNVNLFKYFELYRMT